MNSLMSYGSDDNSDGSGEEKYPEMPGGNLSKSYRKQGGAHEDNYEEVGMDMSEDSNDSSGPSQNTSKKDDTSRNPRPQNPYYSKRETSPPQHDSSTRRRRSRSRSPKCRKEELQRKGSIPEEVDQRRGSNREEDRYRSEDKHSRGRRDDDRGRGDRFSKEADRGRERDRYRDEKKDGRRDDRSNRDDRYRDRRDKDRRRSKSRDRRRSRSPRRSRSGSKERERGPTKGFSRRFERASNRMDRLDKLGIEFKPDNYPSSALMGEMGNSGNNAGSESGGRFFMPGITGRFRDQIEKRKMLWQKAKEPETRAATSVPSVTNCGPGGSNATKVYEATSFADDKTSNKFKRLMGIRGSGAASAPTKGSDVLKKQEEMFSSMEAQYEVARTATHTMRGVGLGFGSFQR